MCGFFVFSFGLEIKWHLVWVVPFAEPGVTPMCYPSIGDFYFKWLVEIALSNVHTELRKMFLFNLSAGKYLICLGAIVDSR